MLIIFTVEDVLDIPIKSTFPDLLENLLRFNNTGMFRGNTGGRCQPSQPDQRRLAAKDCMSLIRPDNLKSPDELMRTSVCYLSKDPPFW